jgi:hypothetical protein
MWTHNPLFRKLPKQNSNGIYWETEEYDWRSLSDIQIYNKLFNVEYYEYMIACGELETVVAYFKILSRHSPRNTVKIYKKYPWRRMQHDTMVNVSHTTSHHSPDDNIFIVTVVMRISDISQYSRRQCGDSNRRTPEAKSNE